LASAGLWLEHADGADTNSRQVMVHDVIRRKSASMKTNWHNLIAENGHSRSAHMHTQLKEQRRLARSTPQLILQSTLPYRLGVGELPVSETATVSAAHLPRCADLDCWDYEFVQGMGIAYCPE